MTIAIPPLGPHNPLMNTATNPNADRIATLRLAIRATEAAVLNPRAPYGVDGTFDAPGFVVYPQREAQARLDVLTAELGALTDDA